jgi:small-conductance mechanosensitive channel
MMINKFAAFLQMDIEPVVRATLLMITGYFVARILSASAVKAAIKHLSPQQTMLLRRVSFYFIIAIFAASAIQHLGFHIGALLGAAGILTVAIGIASQTSMSNIISGIFMIGEKPFEVGHVIKVDQMQGEILSIDLLSVRIRTQDNMMVRIPNEMLIKSSITNLSFFPIRRADLKISVAYKEDLTKVKSALMDVANKNPLSLMEPKPLLQILDFGDSGVDLQFSVWSTKANFIELKNTMYAEIKQAFYDLHIEMGSTSRSLFIDGQSEPLMIKLTSQDEDVISHAAKESGETTLS